MPILPHVKMCILQCLRCHMHAWIYFMYSDYNYKHLFVCYVSIYHNNYAVNKVTEL